MTLADSTRKLAVLCFAGLVACQAPRPEPFAEFAVSIRSLRTGADKALEKNYDWSKERYLRETSELEKEDPERLRRILQLLLRRGEDGFSATMPGGAPLFMKTRAFRAGVEQLNAALESYANLLHKLASSGTVPYTLAWKGFMKV